MAAPALIRYDGDFKQQTSHLPYTPDFNTRLEAIMCDRLATIGERYMAWIKLNSWGRGSFYVVKNDGTPAWQRDAVEALKIDKRRISAAHNYYVKRGYLLDEAKIIYPCVSPSLGPDPEKVRGTPDFFTNFLPEWKVSHTPDFLEWEQARETRKVATSTVKRVERIMKADYKRWTAARTSPEKSPEPRPTARALKSVGTYLPTESSRYVGTETGPTDQPIPPSSPEPTATVPAEPNPVERQILLLPAVQEVRKKLHSVPSPRLLQQIVEALQGAPPERLDARIRQRFGRVKTFGFLLNLAQDVGNAFREEPKANPEEGANGELEKILLDPDCLSIVEAEACSGFSADTLFDLIESGRLPAINVGPRSGGKYRIMRADLDKLNRESQKNE